MVHREILRKQWILNGRHQVKEEIFLLRCEFAEKIFEMPLLSRAYNEIGIAAPQYGTKQ